MSSFKCYNCRKNIKKGYQCAIRTRILTVPDTLNFCDVFCSTKCLQNYLSTPHIYGPTYVEHFWNSELEKQPPYNTWEQEAQYHEWIDKHKTKFRGRPKVSKQIAMQSAHLDGISNFILGNNK